MSRRSGASRTGECLNPKCSLLSGEGIITPAISVLGAVEGLKEATHAFEPYVVVISVVLQYVGLSNTTDLLVRIGRWPALFVALAFALACIYRFHLVERKPRRDSARLLAAY